MDMHEALRTQMLLIETVQQQKKLLEQSQLAEARHRQENERLRHQLMKLSAAVEQSAQRLEHGGQRFAQEALKDIGTGSRRVLQESAVDAVEQVHRRTAEALQELTRASKAAGTQAGLLGRAQTTLVWKSLACLALGGLFLVGGTLAWSWSNARDAQRHRVDAELGRRIAESDVVQCGEGLCANVDMKAQRVGDHRQYRPIKRR